MKTQVDQKIKQMIDQNQLSIAAQNEVLVASNETLKNEMLEMEKEFQTKENNFNELVNEMKKIH